MKEAMKKKCSFKCSDIPIFKLICGTFYLVLTIIAIAVLIWWLRFTRAVRKAGEDIADIDYEGAFDAALEEATAIKAFNFPYGTLAK